ncbi:hypothetical protein HX045_15955 [Myroides odoratimimus]|uniref:Uncharacterized protein n=1 Tax=Myroides odoratimimus CCUG 10230 TaxID=883150 RepID=A0ABN0EB80_9FLAO|nr:MULTISPECIES: hypothetical protein [Myroides]APA93664.1 hypothetical protein BK054_15815 [Myroides sp. ZB35]EHO08182.1 hypothetical protein HMPREF9714_02205 [Myroides odoratimimus CCUG 12901]EHO10238.1 hypothetical protein HMPREF9712_01343 [Myroides odoratimimus CCUG 10230]EKB05990.1 hypothetical protein HMPREF9711_00959 [Myroides odoratimimus CCUG 3837]EPH13354.1 hypothetical protein HMPREF9713_00683 [Myroides odoratimimus CCUG 12700]
MKISNQSGQVITKQKAIEYITEFKAQYPDAINSYYVGIDKLQALLSQTNCIGMRIYPGLNKQTALTNMVLVGVDQKGQDISDGIILEELITCPPACSYDNTLG